MTEDWKVGALVELEDIACRVRALKETLGADIRRAQERFHAIMQAVQEEARGLGPIVVQHATHAVVIPAGAFCCDVAIDEADDDTLPCYCAETSMRNCPRHCEP